MATDPARILALLRDPNMESQQLAEATGLPRDEAARAARLAVGIARAKPEEAASLPGPFAAAVARAAFEAGRADVLAVLAGHGSKGAAKEARRGLHILKSRGVAVPEPPRPPASAPAPSPDPDFPAYASAIDGGGERAVWIARAVPGRGVEVGQAVLSDVFGLTELRLALLGRKEFRAFARDVAERGRAMAVGEIPRERAVSLVAAAQALNQISGRRLPDGADGWIARLGPAAALEDPAAEFPPLSGDAEREALAASARLHALPVLRGWLADEDHLRTLAQKLDEISVSPLYIDERQRREQAARALADAVERYLDEPRRRRLSARLYATASHLSALGQREDAVVAAAVARALAAGAPASGIPFARLLVEKAFPARGREGQQPEAPGAGPGPPEPRIIAPR